MPSVHRATIVALSVGLSACSDPVHPADRGIVPDNARFDAGLYMGSGLSADSVSIATDGEGENSRGGGYIGSGH